MYIHKGDLFALKFLPNFYSWGISLDHFYRQLENFGQSSELQDNRQEKYTNYCKEQQEPEHSASMINN